jgi:hypothetical protein
MPGSVVVEYAEVLEDLSGPLDAQAAVAQHRGQLGQADGVIGDMTGQRNDQAAVDVLGQPTAPAASFTECPGCLPGLHQGGVGQVVACASWPVAGLLGWVGSRRLVRPDGV